VRSVGLLGLVVGVMAVAAAASPLVAWAAAALGFHFTFGRLFDRVFEVLLIVGFVLAWRPLHLGDAKVIGLAGSGWRRQLARGVAVGLAGIAVGLVLCWAWGALMPGLRYAPGKTVRKATLGALAAVAIGVGEEALFRGVVLRRLSLDLGRVAGVVVTTAVYAVVHALRTGGGRTVAGPWAGVGRVAGLFAPLADPVTLPSVVGLAGLGLVLAFARLRTGGLWTSIGIHASWVAVFRVGRLFFELRRWPAWLVGPGWPPLVGGAGGWVALAATMALLLLGRRSYDSGDADEA
jgi:membrane protease YdiL (CAAX protease family)